MTMLTAEKALQLSSWALLTRGKFKHDYDSQLARILAKIQMAASVGEVHVSYYHYGGPLDSSGEDFYNHGEYIDFEHAGRIHAALRELGFALCGSNKEHKTIIGWSGISDKELWAKYGN